MNSSVAAGVSLFPPLPIIRRYVLLSWSRTALLQEEFAKRNVKVLAVSVDGLEAVAKAFWINDINETQQLAM